MPERGGARDQEDVWRPAKEPGERDLHRRGAETLGHLGEDGGLQRGESSEGEEWHIGDAVVRELIDQRIVRAMREVVMILYADDLADPSSFRDLRGRDVAQSNMADEAFALQLGQG